MDRFQPFQRDNKETTYIVLGLLVLAIIIFVIVMVTKKKKSSPCDSVMKRYGSVAPLSFIITNVDVLLGNSVSKAYVITLNDNPSTISLTASYNATTLELSLFNSSKVDEKIVGDFFLVIESDNATQIYKAVHSIHIRVQGNISTIPGNNPIAFPSPSTITRIAFPINTTRGFGCSTN